MEAKFPYALGREGRHNGRARRKGAQPPGVGYGGYAERLCECQEVEPGDRCLCGHDKPRCGLDTPHLNIAYFLFERQDFNHSFL